MSKHAAEELANIFENENPSGFWSPGRLQLKFKADMFVANLDFDYNFKLNKLQWTPFTATENGSL